MNHPLQLNVPQGGKAWTRTLCALVLLAFNLAPNLAVAENGVSQTASVRLKEITFEDGSLTHPTSGVDRVVGAVALDNQASIHGTYAASLPSVGSAYLEETFTQVDDLSVSFYFRLNALPASDVRIALISTAGTSVGNVLLRQNGALRLRYGSTTIGADTPPLAIGTLYRLGLHQKRGTGGNAVLEAFLAMGDEAFAAPFASTTTGTWTSPADRLRLGATTSSALNAVFDTILLDSGAFGGTPPPTSTPIGTAIPSKATPAPTNTSASPTQAPPTPTLIRTSAPTATPVSPSATPTGSGSGPNRLTCSGYPQTRVFLESQAWWLRTPGQDGTDHGHIHIGTCFPYAQRISGKVEFDIRLILHDNPGKVHVVLVDVQTDNGTTNLVNLPISFTCSDETCEMWVHVTADTTKVPHDGRQEFRFRAKVSEPDGTTMFPTTGWQAYLANGKSVNDYRSSDLTIARGWYTDAEYTNAALKSDLPLTPVSGVWSFKVSLKPGSGGIPVTYHHVLLDANFHGGIPGTVLKKGTGPFEGTITLDTRTLVNGPHKLLLKADADAAPGSTNSGVLVVPFVVQNP
jgi:hypothetical protein